MILITGPGHGAPGIVANTYLEGTYTEVYPRISQDEAGLQALFKQFSFPGGIPSHVAPETPGSINEGGELGYSLAHAYGAVFDNPDLIAPLSSAMGRRKPAPGDVLAQQQIPQPGNDGAVLPILHLNGYKIANATVLARIKTAELDSLLSGYGYKLYLVEGDNPTTCINCSRRPWTRSSTRSTIPEGARAARRQAGPPWPDDYFEHAQGLDRTKGGRWQPIGRHLARPPGADVRACHQA